MKKKKKYNSRLWIYFALIVFSIMLSTALIMTFVAYFLFQMGHLNKHNTNPLLPVTSLLFMSVIIGTSISLFVAKKILKPITNFSNATDEVAKGNFDIRIDEESPIEEIRDLSKNFNMMAHELSSIETLRNDFIVNVSHEFKTPIATIEGYATLLQDNNLSDTEHKEYSEMIIYSARQLNTLSSNILSLSKLENQEIILEKELYRLDEQIRQAIMMLEPDWGSKDLIFNINLIKTEYFGNESLLMQVWINLIGNAIKFTSHGGSIHIDLSEKDSYLIFEISDTGIGIDDSIINHIFDKFYQGDTTRKTDGNGLGLALVKRIIDLSDGSITVKSKVKEGTTFIIKLPIGRDF